MTETARRLFAFHCGGDWEDIAFYDPADPRVGTKVYCPYFIYLVDHPDGWVLFDTGCHPSVARDPAERLGDWVRSIDLRVGTDDNVLGCLKSLGLSPVDVTHVVQSHLHFDHAGGLEYFPHATIYVQAAELRFAHWPPPYQRSIYVERDFSHSLHWKELTAAQPYDVFCDGSLLIVPTPGHTPGSQSLLVRLPRQKILLLSDATYSLGKMRQRVMPGVVWSPDTLCATWDAVEELERTEGARLVCSHELDFRDHVLLAPDNWYE